LLNLRAAVLLSISAFFSVTAFAATTVTISDTVIAPASQMGVNVGNATANYVDGSCFESAANGDGFAASGWGWFKAGGAYTASVDTTTKTSGRQSQRLVVTGAPCEMRQGRVDLPQAALTTQLVAGQTYTIKARMRASTNGARMRLGFVNESWGSNYPTNTTALTTNWAEYSWSFTPTATNLWRGVTVQFLDNATYWIDDLIAWNASDIDPATGFIGQYVNRLKELKPRMLRLGGLGVNEISLERYLFNPWPISYGPPPREDLNINTFMALCKTANASPFICVPPAFTDTASAATQTGLTWDLIANHFADHGNLVDYLGGEANSTYGARRIADGFARWDTQFPYIYYEMGNETWGTPDDVWDMDLAVQPPNTPFPGAPANPWLENYAVYCQRRMAEMKGRSGWRGNMRVGFGGFAADSDNWANYRTRLIPAIKNLADFGTIFMYYGTGSDANTDEQIYGALFGKAVWHEREIKAMNAKYKTAAGKDVPVVIYEGNCVWGNYYNGPSANDQFVYSKEVSLGAGVSLLDNYCAGNRAGVTFNNHFAFTGGPWSVLSDAGYHRKPSYFALQIMNEHLKGDLITSTVTGSGTYNDTLSSPAENNVPYVACYPYKEGNTLAIAIVNRHRTQAQQVTINRTMTLKSLVALTGNNINLNCETSQAVTLQTTALNGAGDSYTLTVPPFSANVLIAVDGVAPVATTGLSAAPVSSSEIALTWTDVSNNEVGFSLERSLDNQNWTSIATLPANTTAYTDSGLTAATLYFYRIKTFNDAGESPYDGPVSTVTNSGSGGGGNGGGDGGGGNPTPPGGVDPSGDFDGDGILNGVDTDDDGDGIPDVDDTEPFSVFALKVQKVAGKMAFGISNKDGLSASGILSTLPAGFNPDGQVVQFNLGGASQVFTLDAKGRAKTAQGSFQLKLKFVKNKTTKVKEFLGGDVPFKVKLAKGTWSDDWADEGANPAADAKDVPLTMKLDLSIGGKLHSATIQAKYKAKANKSGSFSATMK
jgi:hypothetical protein